MVSRTRFQPAKIKAAVALFWPLLSQLSSSLGADEEPAQDAMPGKKESMQQTPPQMLVLALEWQQ